MDQIELALKALTLEKAPNYAKTAREFGIDRSTLSRRHREITTSRAIAAANQGLLHREQEKRLIAYINDLCIRGFPPTTSMVYNFAAELARRPPGKNWVSKFVRRWQSDLDARYLGVIESSRTQADQEKDYRDFYTLLAAKIAQYEIESENMYNMDEKGFLIGIMTKQRRIVTKSVLMQNKSLSATTDGNREWITVLACICADGSSLPPGLIYQAVSGNLQDSWLQDFNPKEHDAFFASSPTGWTNDELGFQWLTTVFDRYTKPKARRRWRLLIIDGHGSHINMRFLTWCDENKILVCCYPPHTTHRLQPLDVSLFSPLATYYGQELNQFISESQGLCSITKRDFFRLFWVAWQKAFTEANILSGWTKTGLNPIDQSIVLRAIGVDDNSTLEPRPTSKSDSISSQLSSSDFRHLKQIVRDAVGDGITQETKKLHSAMAQLSTDVVLLRAENQGLRRAIINEKKKRKRGKPLFEALRAETSIKAQFYSPSKIQRAQDLYHQKEHEKQILAAQKQEEKLLRIQRKEEKERSLQERRDQRLEARTMREQSKAQITREKEITRQARLVEQQIRKELKSSKSTKKTTKQAILAQDLQDTVVATESTANPGGELSWRPQRKKRLPYHLQDYEIA
jgi:DDE superfamily endonuclease/Tc5 transposase DNA-binding domain